jgi:hypothetical protein
MALTVPGVASAPGFDATLIDQDDWILSSAAQSGSIAAWSMLRGPLRGTPQFIATAKTTDNSAASNALDLTTLGLTFPSKCFRRVFVRSTAVNGADSWTQEIEQIVWGNDGTTPVLLGAPRLITAVGEIASTAVKYGNVEYHGTTSGATVTNGADVDTGLSLGNFSSGVATLTVPLSRNTSTAMRVRSAHISEDAGTIGDLRTIQVRAATSTTFTVNVATSNGTEALTDPNGVNNVDIGLTILPPPSVAVVMSSNNVQIHVGYNATDNVYHRIEVWATRADIHLLAVD